MAIYYQPGTSLFHRLDPLTKFIWLCCVSILCLANADPWMQGGLFAAVAGLGRLCAGQRWLSLWKGIRLVALFAVPYFVLQLIFVPGTTELFAIGGWALTLEALGYASAITFRLLTLTLSSYVYIATTDPQDLVLSLAQHARIPYRFAYGISIALRFLPILRREADLIRDAQRLRGLSAPRGWRGRLIWQRRFALAVFTAAVRRVEILSAVMELKGFGASNQRTFRRTIRITAGGKALAAGSLLAAAAGLAVSFI